MRAAGCDIPPWMLLLKKGRSGRTKSQRLAHDARSNVLGDHADSDDEAPAPFKPAPAKSAPAQHAQATPVPSKRSAKGWQEREEGSGGAGKRAHGRGGNEAGAEEAGAGVRLTPVKPAKQARSDGGVKGSLKKSKRHSAREGGLEARPRAKGPLAGDVAKTPKKGRRSDAAGTPRARKKSVGPRDE